MNEQEKIKQLEQINRDLTQQLVQSERLRSLGALSNGVAHHFNNLLSVILGYSSYVINREKLTKEAENALQKISEAAQRGRRLTDEILAFASSESEAAKSYHVHDTLVSVLSLLEVQTSGQIEIVTELEAENDRITAPQSSLHQIIFNLITNAIDSMPAGGSLIVKTSNMIMPDEDGSQHFLRIEVEDTSGIVPEQPVTDEDFQIKDRVGMKLSSVYGMVGQMDGTILMSSQPGDSTRVEVLLPVTEADQQAEEKRTAVDKLEPATIWVVDDNVTFREMCDVVLGEDNHTITKLSCGEEMINAWNDATAKPDLLVIDFSMPDYNGLELREWLDEHEADVPIVLVSGLSIDQPDIKEALEFRRTFFLQKPFASSELLDIVNVALGEHLLV